MMGEVRMFAKHISFQIREVGDSMHLCFGANGRANIDMEMTVSEETGISNAAISGVTMFAMASELQSRL